MAAWVRLGLDLELASKLIRAAYQASRQTGPPIPLKGFSEAPHGHRHHHRKSHRALITVLCIVVALVAALGVSGYFFYKSVKAVVVDASSLVAETTTFSKDVTYGDSAALSASATKIEGLSSSMEQEAQSPLRATASTRARSLVPTSRACARSPRPQMISPRRS